MAFSPPAKAVRPGRRGQPGSQHLQTSQALSAVSAPSSPSPDGPSAGTCAERCCWHWLSAVLLEELHLLKKAVVETRESFVEQERIFLALESAPDREAYARVLKEHSQLRDDRLALEEEVPALQKDIAELQEELVREKQDIKDKTAEVAGLQRVKNAQESRLQELESKQAVAENTLERVAAHKASLKQELDAAEKKLAKEKNKLDMIISERDGYQIQANFFAVSGRKKSTRGSRATRNSSVRSSSIRPSRGTSSTAGSPRGFSSAALSASGGSINSGRNSLRRSGMSFSGKRRTEGSSSEHRQAVVAESLLPVLGKDGSCQVLDDPNSARSALAAILGTAAQLHGPHGP